MLIKPKETIMRYPYECEPCNVTYTIIKHHSKIDDPEKCNHCNGELVRRIAQNQSFSGADEWDYKEYNPGLGCWTKGTKHAEKIAKERGLECVGNTDMNKWEASKKKEKDQAREKAWDAL